MIIDYLY